MIDDILLIRYIDGKLDPETAATIADELRRDLDLQRRLKQLRRVEPAYREALDEQRRPEVWQRKREAQHYDLITRSDLETLAEFRSPHAPVFSLYLDLDPHDREHKPPWIRVKNLLRAAEQRVDLARQPHAYRARWNDEAQQLRAWFDSKLPNQGRGTAWLSCQALAFWRTFHLPVPVRDRLEVSDRPYLRPLALLVDEYECYMVVLIDAGNARIITIRMGAAQEDEQIAARVPRATGDLHEKTGHAHSTHLRRHARHVVERAESMWNTYSCDWIVIGGVEEALGELRNHLPKALRDRVAGELHLTPQIELNHIIAKVQEIEREHERRIEMERLDELVNTAKAGGAAVLGLRETLRAVTEERVRLLLVDAEFGEPGWECPNCRFLGAEEQEDCPLCGTALNAQPDVVELAMERVLEQDGVIEVVRGREQRQRLDREGRIGALLRYAYPPPPGQDETPDGQQAAF